MWMNAVRYYTVRVSCQVDSICVHFYTCFIAALYIKQRVHYNVNICVLDG